MTARIELSITSGGLVAALQPAAPAGLARWLPALGRRTTRPATPAPVAGAAAPTRLQRPTPAAPEDWPAALEQLAVDLQALCARPLRGLTLEVLLGLQDAHLGLMALDATAGMPSASAGDAYAQAWVRQMLHTDPQDWVVRWKPARHGHALVVSCVNAQLVASLQTFCGAHGLRFASCRPAVALALSQAPARPAGDAITVWTEAGPGGLRAPRVQMLRLAQGELVRSWRGWVPPPRAGEEDAALAQMVRRFAAQAHGAPEQHAPPVRFMHWPALEPGPDLRPVAAGTVE